MFDSCVRPTGTKYTTTVALLLVAFVLSPAVLMISRPFGYWAFSLAAACSALCATLAWFNWSRFSKLSIPTIMDGERRTGISPSGGA